ncbi:MAG: hypothetical protein NT013_14010 [Planctomycetia bacterium]|nr:hypothetical protein [Planctomycetia bacterium]
MSDELEQSGSLTAKLVAYLDGELPEAAARDVEQSLASDPEVRAEVEKLNRAWELLDLLPRPSASGEFSNRTLATMKAAEVSTDFAFTDEPTPTVVVKTQNGKVSSPKPLIVWITSMLVIAVFCFFLGRLVRQSSPDPLLDDLPLIENLDLYQEIGDAEFLRDFQRRGPRDDRRQPERR